MARPHVSVATICFDGFGDKDFVPAFTYAPELGIHEIEFNAWYPRNLTPAGLESIRRRCDEAGLRPVTLHVSGFAPGPERADLSGRARRGGKCGQVRDTECSVGHVEVFRVEGVRTSIIGRPRPSPPHRRATHPDQTHEPATTPSFAKSPFHARRSVGCGSSRRPIGSASTS